MRLQLMLWFSFINICYSFYNYPVKKMISTKLNSHFSIIETKIKKKDILIKSLLDINKDFELYDEPTIIIGYNEEVVVDVAIKQKNNKYLGFKLNNDVYTIVTDLQFWQQSVPVDVFIDKLTKRYAIHSIYESCLEEGFNIESVKTNVESGLTEIEISRYDL